MMNSHKNISVLQLTGNSRQDLFVAFILFQNIHYRISNLFMGPPNFHWITFLKFGQKGYKLLSPNSTNACKLCFLVVKSIAQLKTIRILSCFIKFSVRLTSVAFIRAIFLPPLHRLAVSISPVREPLSTYFDYWPEYSIYILKITHK